MKRRLTFLEFFAGAGMARAGLGGGWKCLFANDFSQMKASVYRANWGESDMVCSDVAQITPDQLPRQADLAWASFPCQDLSLAGNGKGLGDFSGGSSTRSGAFWPFWELILSHARKGRLPRAIVLENVPGILTSRGGQDFAVLCDALHRAGYRFGAVLMDARHFLPHSRQRVFLVAVLADVQFPHNFAVQLPQPIWHPSSLINAVERLPVNVKQNWHWWRLPVPSQRTSVLADLIESFPTGVEWHSKGETQYLLDLMSSANLAKVQLACDSGKISVGCIYRRTRPNADGKRQQRAEVRFDDIAGCLRTPGGGSSRQTILVVHNHEIRSRLLSPREAARLMGLSDDFKLPEKYNEAYHVAGDGVCVPVVRYLAKHLLEPMLQSDRVTASLMAAE